MTTPPSVPAASPAPPPKAARVPVIDWLRGIAVITMIVAHSFDAWLDPAARAGFLWEVVRHVSGVPSRLFLFLVGVSSAAVFEHQVARGMSAAAMRGRAMRRGLGMLGLAYLFRVQEHILAGFWGGWQQVFRVDILNCIAISIMLVGLIGVPRAGRRRFLLPLAVAAVLMGLGPIIGPAKFPDYLPPQLTSYIGGQRPMSWFPIFPWGAWSLVGLVIGQIWLVQSRKPDRGLRCFVVTGVIGLLSSGTVLMVRAINPEVIRYPSELVAQMGPGSFFFRLGVVSMISCLGFFFTRWQVARQNGRRPRVAVLTTLGQTSLLVYWIHVEICYGFAARPIQKQLGFVATTFAFLVLTAAMYGLALLKIRYGNAALARLGEWLPKKLRGGAKAPPAP